MKNIIVKGKPELRKRICQCPNCGCQFNYTDDEIYKVMGFYGFVICPWCLEEIKTTVFANDIGIDDYTPPKEEINWRYDTSDKHTTFDGDPNSVPQTLGADASTGGENSAGSYEAMVDEIG